MNLQDLAQKPQLTKILIDDEAIVEKYGDSLTFYVYDRQPLNVFAQLANADEKDVGHMGEVLAGLILNEKGEAVIVEDKILPMDVMMKAMTKIGETLGKSQQQL
tara:strand:- start:444 stop:755 length:312 start_codon:yes stop_codon:yes gene_type:complete